ncbi:MAG: hypothetical protein U0936_25120 [Planctomycetaceae bacterium]
MSFALGAAHFSEVGGQRIIESGVAWLDSSETWDNVRGGGDVSGTFDFYTVVSA